MAYIPFKENASRQTCGFPAWRKMYHEFKFENDEFRYHYHKRPNVETTFHVVETEFGDSLNAKNEQAQCAETLLEILCTDVVLVIHDTYVHEVTGGPLYPIDQETGF